MNALEAILDAFGPLIMQYLAICAGLWMLLWAVSGLWRVIRRPIPEREPVCDFLEDLQDRACAADSYLIRAVGGSTMFTGLLRELYPEHYEWQDWQRSKRND